MTPHEQSVQNQAGFCCANHSGSAKVTAILDSAEALAQARKLRLTPVRRRALEILVQAHGALGAYEVLEKLAAEGFGAQPPVAYRALNFLVEHGFAHRIRRLNAFTACPHPGQAHRAVFFICSTCDSVTEASGVALGQAMESAADSVGFAMDRTTIEAVGQCRRCQDKGRDL